MNISDWLYIPGFTKAPNGDILRDGPPKYLHVSGAVIDVSLSSCLIADMLDVEGKHDEAEDVRAAAAGDIDAFQRLLNRCSQ